jgi:NSS family neurotransmitter:Na+ symporter
MTDAAGRGQWGTRAGFLLAAAGSAIGLGNIWRFTYIMGENGGAAFILVYVACIVLIGAPVFLAELVIGRHTQLNPVGAFASIKPGSSWKWVGAMGVLAGALLLSFYSVVAGWVMAYALRAPLGTISALSSPEESGAYFGALSSSTSQSILFHALFMIITMVIVARGVKGGIERASKIMMPILFVLLGILVVRGVLLPGAAAGIEFMLRPDFSALNPTVVLIAMGHAFFTLSVGMGAMITYGSYLSRKEHLPLAGVSVAFFDTLIALLGGLIIFPALFHANADPAAGPGLVFVVLPTIFDKLPSGTVFAIAFYALLAVAALTSTISLLEVVVSYFVDERGWGRDKAAWLIGGGCFLLSIPSALSNGAVGGLTALYSKGGKDKSFLDLLDMVFGNYSLSIGALLLSLFVGWKWGVKAGLDELQGGGAHRLPLAAVWAFCIRFICPVAVVIVLASIVNGD